MFEEAISELDLASSAADALFPNINGFVYKTDVSLTATLRALFRNRIKPDQQITSVYEETYIKTEEHNRQFAEELLQKVNQSQNCFMICNMRYALNMKIDDFNHIALDGFEELAQIREFAKSVVNLHAFINKETKTCCVLVLNLNLIKFHLIQSMLYKLLPWYYDKENQPYTDQEKAILKSLIKTEKTDYIYAIRVIEDQLDFYKAKIAAAIRSFSVSALQKQKRAAQSNVRDLETIISDLEDRVSENYKRLREAQYTLVGISSKSVDDVNKTTVDYFLSNKNLKLVKTDGSVLRVLITGYLDSYDPEIMKRIIENDASYLYRSVRAEGSFRNVSNRAKLLQAIFSEDAVLKIRTLGMFDLNLEQSRCRAPGGFEISAEYKDYLPNAHLYYYNCLGAYSTYINKRLSENDLIGAIGQCTASVHSTNLAETTTQVRLFEDLFKSDRKCIELPNGVFVTAEDALMWLNQQEQTEE